MYALASPSGARYHWLTLASALSVRAHSPNAHIILLHTNRNRGVPAAEAARAVCVESALGVEVRQVDLGYHIDMVASRALKSSVRELIEGPFIFLDSDTWVCVNLAGAPLPRCDFAAAADVTGVWPAGEFPEWATEPFRRCGWSYGGGAYRNSGVMLWNDTPAARRLGARWKEMWKQGYAAGVKNDQPSLNFALSHSRIDAEVLESRLNAMVTIEPYIARSAKVCHFFESLTGPRFTSVLDVVAARLRETGRIDYSELLDGFAPRQLWVEPHREVCRAAGRLHLASGWRALSRRDFKRARWAARKAWACAPWSPESWRLYARASLRLS